MAKEDPKEEKKDATPKVGTPTKEAKVLTEDQIKAKLNEHRKVLEELSTQGRKTQQQRDGLGQQLNQIVGQSNEVVGAIKALQDLLNEKDAGGN